MAQGSVRRSQLPGDIYAVPVTLSVLVAVRHDPLWTLRTVKFWGGLK